ncbi:MAG: ABC transporter ATP-binding protein, partial [Polyangiaceae bacterium]
MSASNPLLRVTGVSLAFAGLRALSDVSLEVFEGEILAIIGPNGAGKSSLLNVVNGLYRAQEGLIRFADIERPYMDPGFAAARGMARTFQNLALFKGMTVLENVLSGRVLKTRVGLIGNALALGGARREELAQHAKVRELLELLGLEAFASTPVGRLPYGLQKRVELARALAAEPKLLLLDEPMAGMNHQEKQDMSRFILDANEQLGTAVILIEHDMGIVMGISDRVLVLHYGRKIADGSPESVCRDPAVIDA